MARLRRAMTLAAALLSLGAGMAFAQCKAPKPVHAYLRTHRSWSVVELRDLSPADRIAWRRIHRGACPGLATIDLGGRGEKSYALAVTNKVRDGRMERLILLQAQAKRLAPKTLVPAFRIGDPLVVWRGRKRTVRQFGSRQRIAIPHDSIIFEKMGLSSKVFYLAEGKMQTVLVAD